VRTAVVRIGVVLAREGGALARLAPLFRLGLGGRGGAGKQWMSWIHLADLVELFRLAVVRDDVRGALNAVAPQPVTNASFTAALADTVHRPALFPVPALALRLALGEMATVLLASQRVESRAGALGHRYRYPDIASALALCADNCTWFEREQWLPRTPEELFPFFADARNLEAITPDLLEFRVRQTSTPEIGAGTRIDYRMRLRGIPLRWQSVIEDWQPGRAFVDRQTRGPYAYWHHTHEFEPLCGGTLVRDRVRYRLPLGALGEIAAGNPVRRDLDAIFDFRYRRLRDLFARATPNA